ncbi:paired amphipathic helix protein Sin3b isoform X2 [Macrosteles quadrilineatus]|uniref:paired amphipathic helix protein Sin3b isoform X2 n=1 Tax=Macrosteles quadrilineatus TaxID=74068 RepID=UPI0023E1C592|nr:paired amphipathic helix protein Sin3b isoform X2 [Macrosteles quadrilineatus]
MKRRLEETVKAAESSGGYSHPSSPLSPPPTRNLPRTLPTVNQPTYAPAVKPATELRSVQGFTTYPTTMPAITPTLKPAVSGGAQTITNIHTLQTPTPLRKIHNTTMTPSATTVTTAQQQQQIQRLKVEDALSYLDMVKYKFGDQPQVYNDFLDIMKEFKSQSIDTPGVIERVSSLFNGHPELIVGFNTFLPPGYKIEVKTSEQGYSFQVQVSMPSPSAATTTLVPAAPTVHHTHIPTTVMPVATTKPLLLSGTTIVSHGSTTAAVVPPLPPPVPATTPPHFPNHTTTNITQVQAHQAVSQALSHVDNAQPPTPSSQPVEFNHAINYVNKIKNRFQGQPDKYKRFLEILHTYQKEQRNLKEVAGSGGQATNTKQLTEAEVYSQVAKLFEHQEDLLAEFGQFLPDATNHQTQLSRRGEETASVNRKPTINVKMPSSFNSSSVSPSPSPVPVKLCTPAPTTVTTTPHVEPPHSAQPGLKRSPSITLHHSSPSTSHHTTQHPPAKKHKPNFAFRDISLSEAAKFGTLTDFAFFDKVRKAVRSQEVYDNFLRCIALYTQEVVSRAELLQLATPFLGRFPELFRWFKEYIGHADGPPVHLSSSINSPPHHTLSGGDNLLNSLNRPDRPTGEQGEIDFASCKRLGASYCALPRNHQQEKCSGRNALCKEVLNDTWVSFPTWSEESTFVTSRKTQYEEYIYRCEDERFELDLVLEVNAATIRVLEGVHKKLCRMSTEEVAKFHLDDCLGGNSPTIHQRALMRVYGDKGPDIIDGLKKNPVVAVPVVLRRLKAKDEEWREAQKGFNKIWREQNEKYYLKSLDHQGINFKQNDMKALRSKSMFNEIETCYDERHEQVEAGDPTALPGPHMVLPYKDKSVLDDAANLLIHHVKRQTSINKEDKQRIKHMLRVMLPDFFHHPRQELSEDERDTADDNKSGAPASPNPEIGTNNKSRSDDKSRSSENEDVKLPIHALSSHPDEAYTLFFGNGNWYLFFRLHQILCDRLTHIYEQANILIQEEGKFKELRSDAAAQSLRLKPKCEFLAEVEVEDYYSVFLDMVKNVLDGNMDANTYEDTLREMFGIHAYLAFTLDKVVIYSVRQLQHLVSDEPSSKCASLFLKANTRGGAGGSCVTAHQRSAAEASYQRKAETVLEHENCFKIIIYKIDCKLTIEILEIDVDENETSNREAEKWSAYVDRYTKSEIEKDDELDEEEQERRLWGKAIFLPRNVRLWRERVANNKNKIPPKIDSCDDTECKFNLNSYKMVFVLDRESYLYKRQALQKAKQTHRKLSLRMSMKFRLWHQNWARTHLTMQQYDFATEWMMGNLPDYQPNHTIVLSDNPVDKAPYRSYNRYRVSRSQPK